MLLATDSDEVFIEIDAALGSADTQVHRIRAGREVRAAVIELDPDLVILDLQIGSMGGIAACLDLRLEEGAGRLDPQSVLLLLDRDADVFMARRSGADGWLVKPLALAAGVTERVRLATGVVNPYTRGIPVLAQTSAAIQDASRGRFVLGIGSSSTCAWGCDGTIGSARSEAPSGAGSGSGRDAEAAPACPSMESNGRSGAGGVATGRR